MRPLATSSVARWAAAVVLFAALSLGVDGSLAVADPLALTTEPASVGRLSSLAASSRSNRQDSTLFASGYDPSGWSGWVTGFRVDGATLRVDAAGLWGDVPATAATAEAAARPARPHTTASLMDAHDETWPAARLVLSARTDGRTSTGISWEWTALSMAQQRALRTVDGVLDRHPGAEARARDRMAHVRGDRSKEQSATPGGPLRARPSRQGDIVNSKLWRVAARQGRRSMLYVGGNDGMLHGFDAASGEEQIAYLPEGQHAKATMLTRPGYRHAYFVDGSPLSGDLYLGQRGGRDASRRSTYLAGFPGAGGRGYFVLDVTDPDAFDAANARALVVLDITATSGVTGMDHDIGHITGDPAVEPGDPSTSRQITRMNNGRWALVIGNGVNSTDERAVLLIQYLDKGKELVKIPTEVDRETGRGNGLATPRLIDLDGDGTPDLAYAGDLHGNLWKFDLGAANENGWKLAFDGVPLFVAKDPSEAALPQPITTAPVWKAHPAGGLMLAFGTGRALTVADRADRQVQTVYGIRDDTPSGRRPGHGRGAVLTGRDRLVTQTLRSDDAAQGFGTVSSHQVTYTGSQGRDGWFLDLPVAGERVLQNPGWFEGDLIDIWSAVPATSDDAGGSAVQRFLTTIDIIHGAAPQSVLYLDAPSATSGQASRVETGASIGIRSDNEETGLSAPNTAAAPVRQRLGKVMRRASWRQMQ